LETLTKQVEDIRKRMDATSTSADERKRLNLEGTRLNQRLEQKSNELDEDMRAAQVERVNEIGRKLLPVINQFGTDGGYTAVLDSSAQNSPVLFAAKNADVTPDIIRLYDQANPANVGTPGAAPKPSSPSAPKP
jgi:Skp family chaperone for outer membrane proteins